MSKRVYKRDKLGQFAEINTLSQKDEQAKPLVDVNLVNQLRKNKVKFTDENILFVTKDKTGQIVWLEEGNDNAGFKHINLKHKKDFENKIPTIKSKEDLVGYIYKIFTHGDVVQSIITKNKNGDGFERIIKYNENYFFLSGVGINGFITSIYPINNRSLNKKTKKKEQNEND